MSIPEWLQAIQTYMKMLQYNHTGTQFFEIRKTRPLSGLMETAKEMTRESLPIKCLEAVILGIYLTNGQPSVERFPISFKTHFSGNYFHHVVLGIYCNGRYGSLGMSRRSDLMDKPLTYRTLSDLIFEFEDSYKKYLHSVKKVKIGLYVPHEPHSFQPIEWKQLVLNVSKMMRTEVRKELEKFARDMRMKVGPCVRVFGSGCSCALSHPAEMGLALCQPEIMQVMRCAGGTSCLGAVSPGFGVLSTPYSYLVEGSPL
uniref:Vasohibin 2 n=1 Tax=Cyanistes caeruleus TaxID=156563 RepID=A0A8C0V0F1_CYACU